MKCNIHIWAIPEMHRYILCISGHTHYCCLPAHRHIQTKRGDTERPSGNRWSRAILKKKALSGVLWCNLGVQLICFNNKFHSCFGLPYGTTHFGDIQGGYIHLTPPPPPVCGPATSRKLTDSYSSSITI